MHTLKFTTLTVQGVRQKYKVDSNVDRLSFLDVHGIKDLEYPSLVAATNHSRGGVVHHIVGEQGIVVEQLSLVLIV